jgi:hypothetical protein
MSSRTRALARTAVAPWSACCGSRYSDGSPAYEDVGDADRLCRDPTIRWVVGDRAIQGSAASASQMARFETEWLIQPENLAALADLPARWIDSVHQRRTPSGIVLDIDSSEIPTLGKQEGRAYNGHFACTCYYPLFDVPCARATSTAPMVGAGCWSR